MTASAPAATCSNNITELAADDDSVEADVQLTAQHNNSCSTSDDEQFPIELPTLPPNYVVMRNWFCD